MIDTISRELSGYIRERTVGDHVVITWRSYIAIAAAG